MANREVFCFLFVLLIAVSSGSEILLEVEESYIVAYENEKAVLPCRPVSSKINITLQKGFGYPGSATRVYEGKQPDSNQIVTYDPKVGFILDPVTVEDSGGFICRGSTREDSDYIRLTLTVNTGHFLLAAPKSRTIIVKEGSKALLPCKSNNSETTLRLYKETSMGFALVGKTLDVYDYNEDDDDKRVSYDTTEGYIFSTVSYADDNTYMCQAESLGKKEVMYYYMHVEQVHLLHGIDEHYIYVYEEEDAVLPCKPSNNNVSVTLYHTSDREIHVGTSHYHNQTVEYNPNVGFTLKRVRMLDAGSYRCIAKLGSNEEEATLQVYVNSGCLLRHIENHTIYPNARRIAVFPCILEDPKAKVSLYKEIEFGLEKLVEEGPLFTTINTVYDHAVGFSVFTRSYIDSNRYICRAELGHRKDSLDFILNSDTTLLHTVSRVIIADTDDKAVLPCRPTNANTEVTLYIGQSYMKQRKIRMGKQPHRNQTVTYNPMVGFTLEPVNQFDSSWYKCKAETPYYLKYKKFYLEVHTPPNITETNLRGNKSILANPGKNLTMFCKSQGLPFPNTIWFKDGKPVVTDASFELRERNQSLIIKVVQPEHEGTFSCEVHNDLGEDEAERNLTITDGPPNLTKTNLNISQNLITKLKGNLTLICNSHGKPQPETTWFKDGQPVITNANMELGVRNQLLAIKEVKLEHKGIYRCNVSNKLGEVHAEGNVTIADLEPAKITDTNLIDSQNFEVKLGQAVTMFCRSQGNPEPETYWFKDDKPVNIDSTVELSDRNQTLNIKLVDLEHRGTYRCVVGNELQEVQMTRIVVITDAEIPKITDANMEMTVEVGGNLTLFCKSEGKPEPETLWFKDDKLLGSDSTVELSDRNQVLMIRTVILENKGTYRCQVKNGLGEVQAEGTLDITEPVNITDTNLDVSQNLAAEVGANLTMFCKAEGNPQPQILWFKDDKPLDLVSTMELKDNNQTLLIKGMQIENKGTYRCVAQNQLGVMQMVGTVNITEEGSSASTITITVVCVLALIAILGAFVIYIRKNKLLPTLRQYMQLNKQGEETEEHSDFSDRLQEEYLGNPRSHLAGGHGSLVVSECPPGASRPAFEFSDDESNVHSVKKSSEVRKY